MLARWFEGICTYAGDNLVQLRPFSISFSGLALIGDRQFSFSSESNLG